jgi:hypothetical protein
MKSARLGFRTAPMPPGLLPWTLPEKHKLRRRRPAAGRRAVGQTACVPDDQTACVPDELKEPDLDALRRRADFQKLVAEVEAKAEKPPGTPPPSGEKK